jgi:hypothetical protein
MVVVNNPHPHTTVLFNAPQRGLQLRPRHRSLLGPGRATHPLEQTRSRAHRAPPAAAAGHVHSRLSSLRHRKGGCASHIINLYSIFVPWLGRGLGGHAAVPIPPAGSSRRNCDRPHRGPHLMSMHVSCRASSSRRPAGGGLRVDSQRASQSGHRPGPQQLWCMIRSFYQC